MKVLITRPRAQADDFAEKLRSAGFEPIFFPVIEIRPVENNAELEEALANLEKYAWVVFTSVNAVSAVFSLTPTPLPQGEGRSSSRIPTPLPAGEGPGKFPSPGGRGVRGEGARGEGARIAAIGPKTAAALRKHGLEPDFLPEEYVAEAILPGLGEVNGKRILLPRAEIARPDLPAALRKAGGITHEITVYRTLPAAVDRDGLAALKSGVDLITFTSASTVENFAALTKQNGLDPLNLPNNPLMACIGPVTEDAARQAGFAKILVAKEYTAEGLVEEIVKRYGKEGRRETGKEGNR